MTTLLLLVHAALLGILVANLIYLRRGRGPAAPQRLPHVSILIPARNEAANLQRLLPTLLAQQYPSFEVIVYDDGSEDATWEVIGRFADDRLRRLRGTGPPPGWVGKVHALFQATRGATGDRYLFLDADTELLHPEALRSLVAHFEALPDGSVLTSLPALRGGGRLLVSLVPNAILVGLPWPLVRPVPLPALGALNGQCWMITAEAYHHHEPHRALPAEVLEDVQIGRYLKRRGLTPVLRDLHRDMAVYMYRDHRDAWRGFRKNAYLILGGTLASFALLFPYYLVTFVVAPFLSPWLLLTLYLLKLLTDRAAGFPLWVSLAAPLSFFLGCLLQLDSAIAHWTGIVSWKGRRVIPS